MIGTVIDGRYEVRAELGHGGMGRLYRAWQASVRREVAIKVIDRSVVTDPMAATRFQREAELASKLSHPNTVSVFDFGRTADGQMYIAMELIAGKTLTALVKQQGAFALPRIARIGSQLCDALETAHALGIVHRDLKLDNVMVLDEPAGRDLVKILDFGLAKRLDDVGGTAMGIVVGTPRYIAPEVSTSGVATPASDLYAIGVMLAELATGAALWASDNFTSMLAQKLQPRDPVEVPPALRAVTRALLDPRPERRPTAAQARALLARAEQGEVVEVAPVASLEAPTLTERPVARGAEQGAGPPGARVKPRRRWLAVAAGTGAVIAGTVAFVATRASDRKTMVARAGSGSAAAAAMPLPTPSPARDPWAGSGAASVEDNGTVTLHVTSYPTGGNIGIENKPYGVTPVDVKLPRGDKPVFVYAGAEDWRAGSMFVTPDRDRIVHLVLAKSLSLFGTCGHCLPKDTSGISMTLLKIRGPADGGAVAIDGVAEDHAPLDVLVRKDGKPLEVVVQGGKPHRVVPDRDQTVLVAPCDDCVEK